MKITVYCHDLEVIGSNLGQIKFGCAVGLLLSKL